MDKRRIDKRQLKMSLRKNFKRNPEGLNLQERKTRPYFGWIFLFNSTTLKTANDI
jgi:hypothetical protein